MTRPLLFLLAPLCLHAQVTINEINAAASERALRWDASGQPRLGSGPAWFDPAFNVSSWPVGPAPLGFNPTNSGLGTNLSADLDGRTASLYLRKSFSVDPATAASADNLRLRIDYFDGFVAYLNGREIARARLGAPKLFVYADQPAFSPRPASPAGFQNFNLGPASSFLQPGENTLAIHVANAAWDGKGRLQADAALEIDSSAVTTPVFSDNFNNSNGASRTHTNSAGTITNSASGSSPSGWLATAPDPSSDPSWSALTITQSADPSGGSANSGSLLLAISGSSPAQPASIPGPAITVPKPWTPGLLSDTNLENTSLSFKFKSSPGTNASIRLEPVGTSSTPSLPLGTLADSNTPPPPDTAAWWRFENHLLNASPVPGTHGTAILNAPSIANPSLTTASPTTPGAPRYSSDTPGARIIDPITGAVYLNTFSCDATAANARFAAPNIPLFNSQQFTFECFLKVSGEPTGYDSFVRRVADGPIADSSASSDRSGWQLEFSHDSTAASYGRIRTRWDTAGTAPALLDFNRIAAGNYLLVDNPSGDGNPANYGPASDVYSLGNQFNDPASDVWHHVALTFDTTTRRVTIFTDYIPGATFTLDGSWAHPNALIEFGKFTAAVMPFPANTPWPLRIDECRYSSRILTTAEMLRVAPTDADGFSSFSARLGAAPPAARAAFLAALNNSSSTSFRLVFDVTDASIAPPPGRNVRIDDLAVSITRPPGLSPLITQGSSFSYRPGLSEPSNGIAEPNLPLEPNNPSEAGKPAAFPDLPGFSDWVELRNSSPATVNLSGWHLSDDPSNPNKWAFPQGTSIPPNGFLVVLCDDLANLSGLARIHTSFELSAGGESLVLSNGSSIVDRLDFPRTDPWHSFGRSPSDPATTGFFDAASPGEPNTQIAAAERCRTPDFFAADRVTPVTGGFFSASQTITISSATPGAEIRFTTDGSEPTLSSLPFSGQLFIPAGPNDRTGRIIRARAFKQGAVPSGTRTATFLINQNAALRGVPALCFSGDASRSFFKDHGIMAISGGTYDASGVWVEPSDPAAFSMGRMHGRAFERPLFLEWLRSDGIPGFSLDAGVRIASSPFSRPRLRLQNTAASPWTANATEKPSFNLFFRNDYGQPELDYPFLGQDYPVKSFDQLRPRAGKNDISNPFIKDELVRRIFNDMGHKSVRGQINTLYINGSYKGFFNTVERYREPYFQSHFGSSNPWDIRIIDTVEEGDDAEWTRLLNALALNLSVKANYDNAVSQLDLDECIDYFLLNIYTAMWDWPHNNWVASRERIPSGKWRLHVWDAEGSFGHGNVKPPNYDTIGTDLLTTTGLGARALSQLFRGLHASPEIRLRFADRINRWFFNGNILDDRTPANCWIQRRKDELRAPFAPLLQYTHGTTYSDAFWNNWTTATTANPNAGSWTVPMSRRRSHLFNESPTPASSVSFRTHGLWPATEPATFSQHGGTITPGFSLTISTNASVPTGSTIAWTTDGSDPRLWGGTILPSASTRATSASPSSFSITLPNRLVTTVRVRVRNNVSGEWSALTEATFLSATVPATSSRLAVSQIMYNPPDVSPAEAAAGFTDKDAFEFIELRAIGNSPVSLDSIKFIAGISFDFGNSTAQSPIRALTPGDSTFLVANRDAFLTRYGTALAPRIAGQYLGSLSNSGERLWLTGPDGPDAGTDPDTIRDFSYDDDPALGWPDLPDGRGHSLVLTNPESNPDHALPANWSASPAWAGNPGGILIRPDFASWLKGHFNSASLDDPLIASPSADPDGDGLPNLFEFAFATRPDRPDPAALARLPQPSLSPPFLSTETRVSSQALLAFTITAESSDGTSPWIPLTSLPPIPNPDGTTTLRFSLPAPQAVSPSRFVRLRASALP